jgi:putative transposase
VDRDTKYSDVLRGFFFREGHPGDPAAAALPESERVAERCVRSIKAECLSRMIFFGKASRHALAQYMTHYHRERNHQGVGNQLLQNSGTLAEQSGAAAASVGCSASITARPWRMAQLLNTAGI